MTTEKRLLLFDIDGTILTSGGAGETALKDATRDIFGVEEDFAGITIAGSTDTSLAHKLLTKHKREVTSEGVVAIQDRYLHYLKERITQIQGHILPGILEVLHRLADCPWCVTALLTGNLKQGAEIKLSHYGVWEFFEFGAFSDDHHDRNQLGYFAQNRAKEIIGHDFLSENIFVIGDTPKDVECGRAIGAKTVAIATGNYSMDQLSKEKPDFLFKDFSDVDAVLTVLRGEDSDT